MQTKRITCPKCGVVLEVKNTKDEEVKQVTCPKCKTLLKVKFAQPIEAPTYYGGPKSGAEGATQLGGLSGATVLGGIKSGETQLVVPSAKAPVTPHLSFDGKDYFLQEGQNIIGRKASSSQATVQIETTDRYMSRQHISITVSTLPDGTKKAVLSNYQNKNQTIVDGQEITTGDKIRLTDGDKITMGHTTVVFKL